MSDQGTVGPLSDSPKSGFKQLSLIEVATLFAGYLYVTGYYIDAVFLGNLGVQVRELVRLDYVRIGFVFTLLSLAVTALPAGAFLLTANVRRASKLPHYHVGLIGNALNTVVALGFLVFSAVFITRYETDLELPEPVLGLTKFSSLMAMIVTLSVFGMAFVPVVERLVTRLQSVRAVRILFIYFVEPLRFGLLAVTCLLIYQSLAQLPWVEPLVKGGFLFVLVAAAAGCLLATIWARTIRKIPKSWVVYPLIGFGLMALYFFAITSYVLGAYAYIPVNRGGRLPLTSVLLKLEKAHPGLPVTIDDKYGELTGPVYVIEESDDMIYVGSIGMEKLTTGFVSLQAIKKDNIEFRLLRRIEDGFPRIPRRGRE